jgi:hypothetical protein
MVEYKFGLTTSESDKPVEPPGVSAVKSKTLERINQKLKEGKKLSPIEITEKKEIEAALAKVKEYNAAIKAGSSTKDGDEGDSCTKKGWVWNASIPPCPGPDAAIPTDSMLEKIQSCYETNKGAINSTNPYYKDFATCYSVSAPVDNAGNAVASTAASTAAGNAGNAVASTAAGNASAASTAASTLKQVLRWVSDWIEWIWTKTTVSIIIGVAIVLVILFYVVFGAYKAGVPTMTGHMRATYGPQGTD